MNRRGMLLALVLSLTASACGGGAAGGATAARRNSSVITTAELEETGIAALNVYDAIQRLRPNWLTARGATSVNSGVSQFPAVLMNGSVDQSLDRLRSMRVTEVGELRFIDS